MASPQQRHRSGPQRSLNAISYQSANHWQMWADLLHSDASPGIAALATPTLRPKNNQRPFQRPHLKDQQH
jgi:hypothetical protein